jgi:hypothetical protein
MVRLVSGLMEENLGMSVASYTALMDRLLNVPMEVKNGGWMTNN